MNTQVDWDHNGRVEYISSSDTGVPDPPDYPNVVDMGIYERYEFCGDPSQVLKGDLNLDCYIDLLAFGIMCSNWLQYVGPE